MAPAGAGTVHVLDRCRHDVPLDASHPSLLVLRDGQIESARLETAASLIGAGWNDSARCTPW
ncbi:MAG: hypothetical protein JNK02_16735 [Planctomycetes bacterium]|nr:hypothetical protein [Planctomycetota bacterium]